MRLATLIRRGFTSATSASAAHSPRYEDFKHKLFHAQERKNNDMELMRIASTLNQETPIDYKTRIERSIRMQQGELTEEELQQMQAEERILEEKLKEVEKTRKYNKFFNASSLALMKACPNDILCELGVRAYTGSRDVPQDLIKANGLFQQAELKAETNYERSQVKYFHSMTEKFRLQQEWVNSKRNID